MISISTDLFRNALSCQMSAESGPSYTSRAWWMTQRRDVEPLWMNPFSQTFYLFNEICKVIQDIICDTNRIDKRAPWNSYLGLKEYVIRRNQIYRQWDNTWMLPHATHARTGFKRLLSCQSKCYQNKLESFRPFFCLFAKGFVFCLWISSQYGSKNGRFKE